MPVVFKLISRFSGLMDGRDRDDASPLSQQAKHAYVDLSDDDRKHLGNAILSGCCVELELTKITRLNDAGIAGVAGIPSFEGSVVVHLL